MDITADPTMELEGVDMKVEDPTLTSSGTTETETVFPDGTPVYTLTCVNYVKHSTMMRMQRAIRVNVNAANHSCEPFNIMTDVCLDSSD